MTSHGFTFATDWWPATRVGEPTAHWSFLYTINRTSRNVRGGQPSLVLLLYLFIAIYSLIHILSWSLARYRLPIDATLLLFAARAIHELAERVPQGRFEKLFQSAGPKEQLVHPR